MRVALPALAALLLGCASSMEPDPEVIGDRVRVLGTIAGYHEDGPQITLVPQGRAVWVSITTFGPGCYRRGETEVEVQGLEAVVAPYNYAPLPGSPCTRDLRSFEHTATLRFEVSGTARILVRGLSTATHPYGDTITVERFVDLR